MAILNFFFLLSLLSSFSLFHLISSQNPSGFISIDCGLPANSTHTEPTTGIVYESDTSFIDTGTVHNITSDSIKKGLDQQLWSLRSFPQGIRNCYRLKVRAGTKYLIRASFKYGNYDGKSSLPAFDLHYGANLWDSVTFEGDFNVHKEIIHIVSSSNIEICLVNVGTGIPFISALELRPIRNITYETGSVSLATFLRLDYGSINNQIYRYKDDTYDRIWDPPTPIEGWTSINTSAEVDVNDGRFLNPAPAVMNTAATSINASAPMDFHWISSDRTTKFFVFMYFAELRNLTANETREFNIFLNGKLWHNSTVSPAFLAELAVFSSSPMLAEKYEFSFVRTANSTLPPILNALEIYKVITFPQSETDELDVEGIVNIKTTYGIRRNWQGDPCAPKTFIWQGVNCTFVDSQPPRITSLDLSSNGLTGVIAQDIANLKMLETLDLSNNNLSGPVPDFLAQLPSLRVLNLERNNLSGLLPAQLIEKSQSGSLSLRFGDNPNLLTTEIEKKAGNVVVPVVASIAGFLLLVLIIVAALFWRNKRRKQQGALFEEEKKIDGQTHSWMTTKQHYSYSDILKITNNFERLLGEGGFGRVYYGRIDNIEVAIKMLSPRSAQGYQQFQAEVDLLTRVHHRNLTALVGYCNEPTNKGLIYEYMGGGNLGDLMQDGKSDLLNWEDRLRIAVDAAHGLEYLHSGIKPAIVHRDVKSSNILLDDNLRAKVSDFGLSRVFPADGNATHVTTNVVGTPGYLDPEYYTSYRLNEKSDVYSFGIVILEIVTGKPVLTKTENNITHIYKWVESLISQGDISSIIDPKLKEDFDVNSVWKAVEIAMACSSSTSTNRPNMSQVVVELNECLAMESACSNGQKLESETVLTDSFSLVGPTAR